MVSVVWLVLGICGLRCVGVDWFLNCVCDWSLVWLVWVVASCFVGVVCFGCLFFAVAFSICWCCRLWGLLLVVDCGLVVVLCVCWLHLCCLLICWVWLKVLLVALVLRRCLSTVSVCGLL